MSCFFVSCIVLHKHLFWYFVVLFLYSFLLLFMLHSVLSKDIYFLCVYLWLGASAGDLLKYFERFAVISSSCYSLYCGFIVLE